MKEEQHIQDLFKTIREMPQEVELSAIEKFVLAQPVAAFNPPTGGGSSLLTIKNSIIMISSISVIGSAVVLFSIGGIKSGLPKSGNEPTHQQIIVPDSSILIEENTPDEIKPKTDTVVLPITGIEEPQKVKNNEIENLSVSKSKETHGVAEMLISCDDKDHITSRFVESLVKDGMVDAKSFSLKITHVSFVINNKRQTGQIFEEYKKIFENISGNVLNAGTSLSVSVSDDNCSASLSINDRKNDKQNGGTGSSTGMLNKFTNEESPNVGLAMNATTAPLGTSTTVKTNVTRNLSPFSNVVLLSGGSLHVEEGDTYSVSLLAGNESDFEKVTTEVKNNVLFVNKHGKTQGKKWLVIRVTIPADKLSGLTVTGSGTIDVESQFNALNQIVVSGSGSIDINKPLAAADLQAAVVGSGSIRIMNLKAKSVVVAIPGSGSVEMGGTADEVKTSINGSGFANLNKLQAQSSVCAIAGSGMVDIKVERELSVLISGSGTVNYWGSPKVTQSITGSGSAQNKGQ